MAVYSVEGKLGTGKTKFAVWRAQEALQQGRRVASNVDLKPWLLAPYARRPTYMRIPDKPTHVDLEALGHGNPESYDEDRNGVMLLDELGTWLNSRSFQDKSRAGLIDWLIHARKHGWDVYLIVQSADMIDRQVREALIEHQVRCLLLAKIRIPIIGGLLGIVGGRWGYLPRMHVATARVGYGANAVVAERWTYRGDGLHAAYDTRQVFRTDYPHGPHTVLPPWDYAPRKLPAELARERLQAILARIKPRPMERPALKPKLPHIARLEVLPADQRITALRRFAA